MLAEACDFGADQAKAARLDQPANGGGAFGDKAACLVGQDGAIIRDQLCAQSHQRQPKRRFARTRRAEDQQALFGNGHTGGMHGVLYHRTRMASDRQTHDKARAKRF